MRPTSSASSTSCQPSGIAAPRYLTVAAVFAFLLRGAKKLARVDDQFAAGEPGLVDSQEYPFLKKPGLEYYTTKEKRNEMSLYNPD